MITNHVLSVQQACCFAYRAVRRMSSIFRACLKRVCKPSTFVRTLNLEVFSAIADRLTYSRNTVDLGFSSASQKCVSLNMADVDGSATVPSNVWKRMVSFKRKLLGDASVLPSAILEVVTKKSRTVLSHQSNSVEMPDIVSQLDQTRNTTTSDSAVVLIPEDTNPHINATEFRDASPESSKPVLPMEGELFALFDSDNQKETSTTAAPSGQS